MRPLSWRAIISVIAFPMPDVAPVMTITGTNEGWKAAFEALATDREGIVRGAQVCSLFVYEGQFKLV